LGIQEIEGSEYDEVFDEIEELDKVKE